MSERKYIFDVLVLNGTVDYVEEEEEYLLGYDLQLKEELMHVPDDRINVMKFPDTPPIFELTTTPKELCEMLLNDGLAVTVSKGDQELGAGKVEFPKYITQQLFDPTTNITEDMECKLGDPEEPSGLVQLRVRIQSLHPAQDTRKYAHARYTVCKPLNSGIFPTDMIFVLGRTERMPVHSAMVDTRLMREPPPPVSCDNLDAEEEIPRPMPEKPKPKVREPSVKGSQMRSTLPPGGK